MLSRYASSGSANRRGKRGGSRVIYYYRASREQILMLMLYGKSDRIDLTPAQKRQLADLVKNWD